MCQIEFDYIATQMSYMAHGTLINISMSISSLCQNHLMNQFGLLNLN